MIAGQRPDSAALDNVARLEGPRRPPPGTGRGGRRGEPCPSPADRAGRDTSFRVPNPAKADSDRIGVRSPAYSRRMQLGFFLELVMLAIIVFIALLLVTGILVALILGLSSLALFLFNFLRPRRRRHHSYL